MTNAEAVMWYGLFSWIMIAVWHLFPILIKGLFAPGKDLSFIPIQGGKYQHMGLAWIWTWFFDGELIRTLYGATLGDTTLFIFGRWEYWLEAFAKAIDGGDVKWIIIRALEACIFLIEELLHVVLVPQLFEWSRDTDFLSNDEESEEAIV